MLSCYQHELSGGMRQRVGIVFALVLNAHVLILDEPTTALDMLSQAAVLQIIRKVHAARHLTTLVISHDVGVIGELADRTAVMYAGRIVEEGPTGALLADPRHPYTRALLAALPRVAGDPELARPLPGRPPDLMSIPRRAACSGSGARSPCRSAPAPSPRARDARGDRPAGRRVACHATAGGAAVIEARGLTRTFPGRGGLLRPRTRCARCAASTSRSPTAGRSRSSASPAAARPPWAGSCAGSRTSTAVS